MTFLFFEIYSGKSMGNGAITQNSAKLFFSKQSFVFFLKIGLICVLLAILFFVIIPKIRKHPQRMFLKYKSIRKKLFKLDDDFRAKKLTPVQYSNLQTKYLTEHERLATILSKYPEYLEKLAELKKEENGFKVSFSENAVMNDLEEDVDNQISLLYNLLLPQAKYYSEEEIKQAVLDEGFSEQVADKVINMMKNKNVQFGVQDRVSDPPLSRFFNNLFSKLKKK
ncbi:MAG TPA: hypothetical protein PLN85_02340 [archaeon]|nr:hypothetical protein [archaeon]HRT02383.1 hypothetical protein [Candidatus Diapherotrites archaeon]